MSCEGLEGVTWRVLLRGARSVFYHPDHFDPDFKEEEKDEEDDFWLNRGRQVPLSTTFPVH